VYQLNNPATFSVKSNKLFSQKEGFLKPKNHGGHSSFVFPHLCLAKSKVCPPYNFFPKKKEF
jgi:hypothetical protein